MLDIQKELEKFNRLLAEADEEVGGSPEDYASDTVPAGSEAPAIADSRANDHALRNEPILPGAAPREPANPDPVRAAAEVSAPETVLEALQRGNGITGVTPAKVSATKSVEGETYHDDSAAVEEGESDVYYDEYEVDDLDEFAEGSYSTDDNGFAPYEGGAERVDADMAAGYLEYEDESYESVGEEDDVAGDDEFPDAVTYHAFADSEDAKTGFDDDYQAVADEQTESKWQVTEHLEIADDAFPLSSAETEEDRETAVEGVDREATSLEMSDDVAYEATHAIHAGHISPVNYTYGQSETEGEPESVGSLLHGARIALTDSHHVRPSRISPAFTVSMPEREEHENEENSVSRVARILPLFTFRAGMFEERLGAVVGAVAGLVILVAGALFVPSLFSTDEPEADVADIYGSESDHLLAAAEPLTETTSASLSIATFPPGARVYLNAELVGVTPFKDIKVDRGDYQVSIEKADFAAIDTFLSLDTGREFFFDLSEEEGLIVEDMTERPAHQLMQIAPGGLDTSDEQDLADMSLTSAPVPATRTPSVVDMDRRTVSEASSSGSRERTAQAEQSRLSGALVVTSEPMGATVLLDDEPVGETPATLPEVLVGRVRLTLQKEGYVPYETELRVMPSIQTPFHAALAPVKASLFVNATPGGDLYVDGELVSQGIAPGHMEMVALGKRTVKIVNPEYGEYEQVVDVTGDNKASVSVDMVANGYQWLIENGDRAFAESRYQDAIQSYQRAGAIRTADRSLENKIALAAKAMAETSMPTQDSRSAPLDGIYSVTDTPPQLIGGLEALHANVIYPEEAYKEGIQGRVYVQLVVDEDGTPRDITIARGLQGGCNEAAIRAIRKSRFKPATIKGVPVKARHTLFVNFTI